MLLDGSKKAKHAAIIIRVKEKPSVIRNMNQEICIETKISGSFSLRWMEGVVICVVKISFVVLAVGSEGLDVQ